MLVEQRARLSYGALDLNLYLRRYPVLRYVFAVLLACLAAALQFGVQWFVGAEADLGSYQFFLGATALSAVWTGRLSALVTLACSTLFKLYIFLPPHYSFRVESPATVLRLVLFVAIGIVVCLGGGALHTSREIFESTLGSIGDAVVATDGDKLVRYMNPVAESLSGWHAEEAMGRGIHDVLHVVDERTMVRTELPLDKALRKGLVSRLEGNNVLVSKNGGRVPVEDSISPILDFSKQPRGAIVVLRDVTEQRLTENALRESEGRYRFLADAVPDVIFTTDRLGRWDYCNQRWHDYTGLAMEQSTGQGWAAAMHPEDLRQTLAGWAEAVRTGTTYEAEYRIRGQEGKYRWFLSRGFPMRDEQGKILRWFGICTDIEDVKRTEEQLYQALKMEAVGRLAGGVAHDFNNLLTVIIGYGGMLSDSAERSGLPSTEAQQILYAAERASELIRQLLTFSRQQIVQPQLVDLNSIVREDEALLRRLIGEDIVVRVSLETDLLPVKIDRSQMDQVIVNLAVNARDAMPAGGHLIIETANVDLDHPYVRGHVTVEPGRYIMLAVSDTGVGMDHEIQSRIFEPFFTTKGPGKGTGLGLSVVYGIIQQSGGHIWAYSEPSQGTTFKIYLPAVLDAAIDTQKTALPSRPETQGTETLLVLEDEAMVRTLVQTMLAAQGYNILVADDPQEALRFCEGYTGTIHLLVTDVVMPEMSGQQVAQQALRFRPALKVLYMSGYTSDAISHHGVLDSGVAFLQKPFSVDALIQKVRDVLDS